MESLLFDFSDFGLSDDESEPVLSLASLSDKDKEDKKDEWYNMSSDSDSDLDDETPSAPPLTLSRSTTISTSASGTTTPVRKEHSIGARIRAITMLNDKVPMSRIIKVTGISRNRIYTLAATARERGWRQDTDMVIEVEHVQNASRSGRPSISPAAIASVLKVVTRNSTTRGFSYKTIGQEVERRGFQVAPRTIWKVLTQAGYHQCKLTVKPGLTKENKLARLAWCLEREH